jgi:copper oxidase (laccase) domain-containing protein
LSAGVLEATLSAMRTPPSELLAWIGPGAGPARYEVGENVYAAFVDRDAGAADYFVPTRPGHWLADLPDLARRRLAAAGVQRVFGGSECTISDPARWYSYRRDGATGRMASLIWIDPDAGRPVQT